MCFPGRVEVALTNQAAVDVRVVGVLRGLHYSWAVILADLCTGQPVDGSVGPVPDVPL